MKTPSFVLFMTLIVSMPVQAQDSWGRKLGEVLGELPLSEYYRKATSFNDVHWVDDANLREANVMYKISASSNVNVRAAATTDSAVISSLPANSVVQIVSKRPFEPWFKVLLAGGMEGFVHESLLVRVE